MISVPSRLAAHHAKFNGQAGRAWIAALPALAESILDRWELTPSGPSHHGVVALVLPVTRVDGAPAALKLQPVDDESIGEPLALRAWRGDGAVRLLEHDPVTGTMLLEALDARRSLDDLPDVFEALTLLAGLLARLIVVPPPAGLRQLRDIASGMIADTPAALSRLADPAQRRVLADCAAAVREVLDEPGEALLHWDLHYQNVLAALPEVVAGGREPWLAIDPKPLVGDPGFELMPALHNRFEPDPRDILRRFDLMTELLHLDRQRATSWTLGRVLQNSLWSIADGATALAPDQVAIAEVLRGRYRG